MHEYRRKDDLWTTIICHVTFDRCVVAAVLFRTHSDKINQQSKETKCVQARSHRLFVWVFMSGCVSSVLLSALELVVQWESHARDVSTTPVIALTAPFDAFSIASAATTKGRPWTLEHKANWNGVNPRRSYKQKKKNRSKRCREWETHFLIN